MLQVNSNERILVFVTVLLFLFISFVATDPSKIHTYTILKGDNLTVICNVTDNPDIEVFWTKNDTKRPFLQHGKRLEILDIKRSYSGDYICQALNTSFPVQDYNETDVNKTVNVIKVDVQYPAEIDAFSIEPHELLENQTFTVTCDFQGNPYPVWSIRNRDNDISLMSATLPGRATLTSPKLSCYYMGYWECTGSNILNNGINVTRGHNITVYCSPRPQFAKNQYVVQAQAGNYTELKMYAYAYPKAHYTWSKDDGTDLSNITNQDDFADGTTLSFPKMSVPYFGNYTLKMQNGNGTYFAHYQIVPHGKPEAPSNLRFSDVTFDSVKLQWTSGFDMGSRQHFVVLILYRDMYIQLSNWIYDNSTNHGINQNFTYVLNKLDSQRRYNLTIVSQNAMGFYSTLAKPSVAFMTKQNPDDEKSSKADLKLILGLTFGILATLGLAALMVYILKYRNFKTSSATISGEKGIMRTRYVNYVRDG